MFQSDAWALPPGLTGANETYEAAFRWGMYGQGIITGALIDAGCTDPTNSPTFELRPGLLLGQIIATGTYSNYVATNTNGSEVASAILMTAIRIQDLTGVNRQRFYGVLVGGPVQAARIIGLDRMARSQMSTSFDFDDDFSGSHYFPFKRFQTKTANYTILATDNHSQFDNLGATGEVDFTLPAIGPGFYFGFRAIAAQTIKVISNEGTNMIAFNNASANSVAYSTGGSIIGGGFKIYSNPAGTKWNVEDDSAGANTVTVA